jgi:hypothetical protein
MTGEVIPTSREAEIPRSLDYATYPILPIRKKPGTASAVDANPDHQGTATMLTPDGLFITARHCINIAFGEKDIVGNNAYSIADYGLLIYDKRQRAFDVRPVIGLSGHPDYDIAIGVAEVPIPGESNYPRTLGLGVSALGMGATVLALGYPGTEWNRVLDDTPEDDTLSLVMRSRCSRGKIEEYRAAGCGLVKAPCYLHTADTPGGMSGGPLLRGRTNLVHAIVSSGLAGGYGVAIDVRAFVDTWRVPTLKGLTLREWSREHPELVVRP